MWVGIHVQVGRKERGEYHYRAGGATCVSLSVVSDWLNQDAREWKRTRTTPSPRTKSMSQFRLTVCKAASWGQVQHSESFQNQRDV